MNDEVRYELNGGVAEIILNRPARKNAVTGPLARAAADAVDAASADAGVHVILLRGEQGVFCSGLDLKEFNAEPKPDWVAGFGDHWRGLHERLFACDKAVVCALEGFAINAGSALALSADYLVVGETAFLQVGEVRQGRPAPMKRRTPSAKPSRVTTRSANCGAIALQRRIGPAMSCGNRKM